MIWLVLTVSDWWFAISNPPPICSFSFMGGLQKIKNQTWMWEIVLQRHILNSTGPEFDDDGPDKFW